MGCRRRRPLTAIHPVARGAVLGLAVAAVGCGGAARPSASVSPERLASVADDPSELYRQAGFLSAHGDVAFVGSVRFLLAPSADSTLALVSFSLANSALTFAREGDRWRAGYDVAIDVRGTDPLAPTAPKHVSGHADVRVESARETTRGEESVIYQQYVTLAPGPAAITVAVRDAGSTRSGDASLDVVVPRMSRGGSIAAIPVYEARPRVTRQALPDLAVNPRATAVFGRDTLFQVYLEGRDLGEPLALRVRVENDERTLAADTVPLVDRGPFATGLARLRVTRLGIGVRTLVIEGVSGTGATTVRMPVVVGLGEGLVPSSFGEAVGYLRYFASPATLRPLREAPPAQRESMWSAFVHATDPDPATPENEALQDYLRRVQVANARYREDGTAGWATDRGAVYAAFGEPDEIVEPAADHPDRARNLTWVYRRARLRLAFSDASGSGHWRLTQRSAADFRAAAESKWQPAKGAAGP